MPKNIPLLHTFLEKHFITKFKLKLGIVLKIKVFYNIAEFKKNKIYTISNMMRN